jgi:hypothetical protein
MEAEAIAFPPAIFTIVFISCSSPAFAKGFKTIIGAFKKRNLAEVGEY